MKIRLTTREKKMVIVRVEEWKWAKAKEMAAVVAA